jgi:hypothetical protein
LKALEVGSHESSVLIRLTWRRGTEWTDVPLYPLLLSSVSEKRQRNSNTLRKGLKKKILQKGKDKISTKH